MGVSHYAGVNTLRAEASQRRPHHSRAGRAGRAERLALLAPRTDGRWCGLLLCSPRRWVLGGFASGVTGGMPGSLLALVGVVASGVTRPLAGRGASLAWFVVYRRWLVGGAGFCVTRPLVGFGGGFLRRLVVFRNCRACRVHPVRSRQLPCVGGLVLSWCVGGGSRPARPRHRGFRRGKPRDSVMLARGLLAVGCLLEGASRVTEALAEGARLAFWFVAAYAGA